MTSLKTIDFGKMGKKFISPVKNTNHKLDGETFDGLHISGMCLFASSCFFVGIKLRIDAKCEISTNNAADMTLPSVLWIYCIVFGC